MSAAVLQVRIAGKSYGPQLVLGPISFDVMQGEGVAILGPSGIGKSTLLRLVAGIDTRFEGRIERPARMAVVFQEPTLLPWRSALDNLRLVHQGLSRPDALVMLARVGLEGREAFFPRQLSLGQQRRLAIARAFAGKPELLILDEPFVSLDAQTAEEMLALTEALMADLAPAMLFVTHAPHEAERLAQRIIHLQGRPARIQAFPNPGPIS